MHIVSRLMVESMLNTVNSVKSAIYTLLHDVRVLVSFEMVFPLARKTPAESSG